MGAPLFAFTEDRSSFSASTMARVVASGMVSILQMLAVWALVVLITSLFLTMVGMPSSASTALKRQRATLGITPVKAVATGMHSIALGIFPSRRNVLTLLRAITKAPASSASTEGSNFSLASTMVRVVVIGTENTMLTWVQWPTAAIASLHSTTLTMHMSASTTRGSENVFSASTMAKVLAGGTISTILIPVALIIEASLPSRGDMFLLLFVITCAL
mmetsp:Transcript_121899/g.235135  ORF Transcript_121899/g.235135 Transcript_121899/m.235135 type:complete len:217 (+) Transcript_121899:748-1398(+)